MLHQLSERYLRPIAIIPNLEINWRAFRILEKDRMPYTKSGVYYTLNKNAKFAQTQAPKRAVTRGSYAVGRGATYNRPGAPMPMPTETKYFDTSFSANVGVANDWTGTEVPMTNYIQSDGTTVGAYTDCALIPTAIGAGYGNINGNQYYLKKLRVKGRLIPSVIADSADVIAAYTTRLCLVLDLQPQGAQAQGESVFSDMGGANQCDFSFLAMGAGSGGRFRILKDKLILHQPGVAGTDGASTNSVTNMGALFNFSVNWRKALRVILKANSATPTVASLANCNIFLLAHSSGPQAGQPVIVGCSRAYYVD